MASFVTEDTVLKRGDGASPEQFSTVPQITSIDPVGFQRSLIDVTNLSSSQREYKLALKDGQEINVELQYDPGEATHTGFRDDNENGTARNIQIVFPTSPEETWTGAVLVMNWTIGAQIDNVIPLRLTLKPTGAFTITP
jgi:hypothetical protein